MTISNQKDNLFKKDFTMVVVGQIISLFGNNVLRYAIKSQVEMLKNG